MIFMNLFKRLFRKRIKMHNIIIESTRLEENHEFGTFGVWRINKEVFCVCLEPADQLNAVGKSSIPAQQYVCKRRKTSLECILNLGLTETFEIMDVPGRTNVVIHPGNTIEHTLGCNLLGASFGKLKDDKRAILNSGKTFKRFMKKMEGIDQFLLTITENF